MIAYDGTVDRDTLVLQTRTLLAASGEMLFEAGKRLCVLKETLPHGEFLKALNEIGIEYRTAQRFMSATIKLGNSSNATTLSHLRQSKIYELALLDDDYLKELDENGTIAGIQLDEYDRMTTRELRKKVRELNERLQTKEESFERLLKAEQETKQKLADELHRLETTDPRSLWTERARKFDDEILVLSTEIVQRMGRLCELCDQVNELEKQEPEYSTAPLHAVNTLSNVYAEIGGWINTFGAKVDSAFPGLRPGLQGDDGLGFGDAPQYEADFEELPGDES